MSWTFEDCVLKTIYIYIKTRKKLNESIKIKKMNVWMNHIKGDIQNTIIPWIGSNRKVDEQLLSSSVHLDVYWFDTLYNELWRKYLFWKHKISITFYVYLLCLL